MYPSYSISTSHQSVPTATPICPRDQVFTEFELGHVGSTLLVADISWLPGQAGETATTTDWLATADYTQYADASLPAIVQLKCTKTRAPKHYNVTCSATRSGQHLGHAPGPFGGMSPQDQFVLNINGEVIPEGTEGHAIVHTHSI
ncbi:hypothetical protein B0T17DRAFT_517655 [Bombardia bombarda]|uniref:Uncharacterized protein n=1 Tax=Bombardia bombarda TaxID=252184 RepID=A0AA39XLR7_9PEZI|nr:hypothetical protein B0T17DRAFT_517655 [Bombardia bombarda]